VLAGSSLVPAGASSESRLTLVRVTSGGTLDPAFGNNGKAVAPPLGYWDQATAIALEPDGKIIVVGSVSVAKHGTQLGLMRYLPNGRLDTEFGTGGTVLTNFAVLGDPAVALQPDGKIVVGGSSDGDFALARYRSDGALDPSFGGGDTVTTPLGPAWLRTHSR